jgi:hypothetical protein
MGATLVWRGPMLGGGGTSLESSLPTLPSSASSASSASSSFFHHQYHHSCYVSFSFLKALLIQALASVLLNRGEPFLKICSIG